MKAGPERRKAVLYLVQTDNEKAGTRILGLGLLGECFHLIDIYTGVKAPLTCLTLHKS